MAGLIDKMNSLPQADSVDIGVTVEGNNNEKPVKDALSDVAEQPKTEVSAVEEKEPEARTPQEKNVSEYKQRKIKAADEKAEKEAARAEKAENELKAAKEEKEEWKRQAQRIAEQRQAPVVEEKKEPQIDIQKDPVGYLDRKIEATNRRYDAIEMRETANSARIELSGLEDTFAKVTPDYADVMKHAEDTEVAKMKTFNPNVNEMNVREAFRNDKVKAAVMFIAQGRDPVKGIYELAKTGYAYQPKASPSVDSSKAEKDAAEKAKFEAVNKNKSKSASGLSAGGSTGDVEVRGPETVKGRKLSDFARLTKAQKDVDYR